MAGRAPAASAAPARLNTLPAQSVAASTSASCFAAAGIRDAMPADVPRIAQAQGQTGMTTVLVDLDAAGRLTGARVTESSGFDPLDREALRSVELSRYSAEVRDCRAVGGSYTVEVDFREVAAR